MGAYCLEKANLQSQKDSDSLEQLLCSLSDANDLSNVNEWKWHFDQNKIDVCIWLFNYKLLTLTLTVSQEDN